METFKSALFILSALLVCYSDARHSKEVYRIDIEERGTRFNETVVVNNKEESVVYTVPEHNGILGSKIFFDYKTGYFATRIPKLKECYIQRIPKGYSSPGLVRENLERYRVFKQSKSAVPVKTVKTDFAKGKRLSPSELSSSLSAFCGDFAVYQAIMINLQEIRFPAVKRNKINGDMLQKRSARVQYIDPQEILPHQSVAPEVYNHTTGKWEIMTFDTCKPYLQYRSVLTNGGCFREHDKYDYTCYNKALSCIYTVECKFIKINKDIGKHRCKETHFFTGYTCCDLSCS